MRVYRSLDNLPKFKNSVITIGSYDGVHYGHQQIIKRLNEIAKAGEGESVLITFHPHPRTIVNTNKELRLLSPLEEKIELIARYEIDNLVIVPFTRAFSQQSPESYVKDFLIKHFQPKMIVIGYDHRFGKNRAGNIDLLKSMSTEYDFQIEEISKQQIDDISVSSTKIRNALGAGEVAKANHLLGHPYFLRGIVVRGQQLGQKIGFPTANLKISDSIKLIPRNGVYAVYIKIRGQQYKGMLNIGVRPTLNDENNAISIEANIFDFNENIYGDEIDIELIAKIREEARFADLQALIKQLEKDQATSLQLLP